MPLLADLRTEDLNAELSALKQEKTHLASQIKAGSLGPDHKLEAMIRYTELLEKIRAIALGLDKRPGDIWV